MLQGFRGQKPEIHSRAYIADGAQVIGRVTMQEFSSVWYNTVVRGDINRIEIGRYTNVQDNSVVHVADNYPAILGAFVTVGHGAVLHGCTIEDHCLIGMGTVVLTGAVIGQGSVIGAGTLIREKQVIPPHSLVVGVPGRVIKTVPAEWDRIHAQAVKYKTLWTEWYGVLPDAGGERYHGETIV